MTDRELMQQSLDVLETKYSDYIYDGAGSAIAGAFEDDVAALRAALAQPAPAVPDDMVMVPREPTQEMIDAADAIDPDQFWSEPLIQEDGTKHRTRDCDSVLYYRAMISAAPAVRKRLTDEQIDAISLRDGGVTYRQLARAIERAHGITGDSND